MRIGVARMSQDDDSALTQRRENRAALDKADHSQRIVRGMGPTGLDMHRSTALLAACAALTVAATSGPALAETLSADAARSFVVGRTFSYKCYEGTTGAGRILADGSVAGTIQVRGQGNMRYVALPAGTLLTQGGSVCAKLKGIAYRPCFQVEKISATSFRGNLAGFEKMWCTFERGGAGRAKLAQRRRTAETTTASVDVRN